MIAIRSYKCKSRKKLLGFLDALQENHLVLIGFEGECFDDILESMINRKAIKRVKGQFSILPLGFKILKRYRKFCEKIKFQLDESYRKAQVVIKALNG